MKIDEALETPRGVCVACVEVENVMSMNNSTMQPERAIADKVGVAPKQYQAAGCWDLELRCAY